MVKLHALHKGISTATDLRNVAARYANCTIPDHQTKRILKNKSVDLVTQYPIHFPNLRTVYASPYEGWSTRLQHLIEATNDDIKTIFIALSTSLTPGSKKLKNARKAVRSYHSKFDLH
jgi:S-methylmethionine-dependent homocysteine/selenocysteine methylase